MITWINTPCGFHRGEFKGRYGAPGWVQKSSLTTEDCLWLGTKNSIGDPTHMYLTREMAGELAHVLLKFSYTGKLSDQP